jgi:hypothetical protein
MMGFPMIMESIRHAWGKPPQVIAFRVAQEFCLGIMRYAGAWPRLERSIRVWWSAERTQHYRAAQASSLSIIAPDAPEALRIALQHKWLISDDLQLFGQRIRDRQFEILGVPMPSQGELCWHSDWRWDYTWKPAYFRSYDFYIQNRPVPYDVRLTWELSRLGFTLPILQNAAIDPAGSWTDVAIGIMADWERQNPLAYSVNWYPMEAAMRGINLVLALEMLLALGESRTPIIALLLRLVTIHGTFVWRTIEYTDIRGNHYAANIIALLLCGLTLRGWYPEARRWLAYAVKTFSLEIALQFLPDGVNFEKSIPYHRLVTELFLIGLIAMERAGLPVEPTALKRIHAACVYTAAYTRPDGLSPNVGDNDDARVLGYDPVPPRDHRPLLGVAAGVFHDADLKTAAYRMPASLVWLLGSLGGTTWHKLGPTHLPGTRYFSAGGVVIARGGEHFLWVDVGEVGLAGRGGHGHNDLLSFELVLQGQPIVVDPGSFVYTGDPVARDLFRSTEYHNGLRVDGVELAPMSGMWRIGNQARPRDIEVQTVGPLITIRSSHTGYCRLPDSVLHTRTIHFDAEEGMLSCIDHLMCMGHHTVERYLHFDPGLEVVMQGTYAGLSSGDSAWVVRWEAPTQARLAEGWASPGYGVRQAAKILTLADALEGNSRLCFVIEMRRL